MVRGRGEGLIIFRFSNIPLAEPCNMAVPTKVLILNELA
jgi:hypothetical protein